MLGRPLARWCHCKALGLRPMGVDIMFDSIPSLGGTRFLVEALDVVLGLIICGRHSTEVRPEGDPPCVVAMS